MISVRMVEPHNSNVGNPLRRSRNRHEMITPSTTENKYKINSLHKFAIRQLQTCCGRGLNRKFPFVQRKISNTKTAVRLAQTGTIKANRDYLFSFSFSLPLSSSVFISPFFLLIKKKKINK